MRSTFAVSFNGPAELSVKVLAGKWTTVILLLLQQQPRRYADLRNEIPRLSDKVLSERLRDLQSAGLVGREGSERTRYTLTPLGHSLNRILAELCEWGVSNANALGTDIAEVSSLHES